MAKKKAKSKATKIPRRARTYEQLSARQGRVATGRATKIEVKDSRRHN